MNFYAISALVNFITSSTLGIFVFSKSRNSKNVGFFIFCFFVAFWSITYYFWQISRDEISALFWIRVLMAGAIFIPVAYLHFVYALVDILNKRKKFLVFSYVLFFLFFLGDFTPYFVSHVEPLLGFKFWPIAGPIYSLFLLVWFFYVIYSTYLLIEKYRISTAIIRLQIKYVIIGMIIGFAGGSTNYFLWYRIPIPPIANILVSVYVALVAYSIIKHRLMDIKFVLRKSYVYLASLSSIIILATIVKYVLIRYFFEVSLWADFIILILAILAFPAIKNYFYRLGNKYFFSSLYDSREVIAEISDKLRTTLEARRIYDFIYESLNKALHFKAFGILGYNEKEKSYLPQYNKGFILGEQRKFLENEELHKMFIGLNEAIVVEEIKHSHYNQKTKATIDLLESLKVDVLAPLNVKDKTIGLIVLGAKESGDMYNDEDLKVLKIVSAQAAIAIENALLYEETLNFTVKLKKEVAKATYDLEIANEELKKLDQAKSDFISIASHQLRTPLTVIKGYISMMLEGSFGKLNPSERDSLEKVYDSGERLIQLVENLLNISRIESGRLQFNYEMMNLEEIVASVAEELTNAAKKRGLKLNYEKGEKPLPKIRIDEEKIRQVIMNLTDNAIKYTKRGSITISLKKAGKNIRFCVSDSGMGMGEEELSNLFKKFSRGEGTSTVHTEGTGLGLYVAKEMVEAHKGKIWAESKGRGRGSKFWFELPIK